MISKPLLNFLIVCFWAAISLFALQIIVFFRAFFLFSIGIHTEPHILLIGTVFILSTLWIFLFVYSLYFFFKYDRYSKSGIFFLFFQGFYALIYFYRVIWQQKRKLVGDYEREPVLGNTIHLETYDNEDFDYDEDGQIETK